MSPLSLGTWPRPWSFQSSDSSFIFCFILAMHEEGPGMRAELSAEFCVLPSDARGGDCPRLNEGVNLSEQRPAPQTYQPWSTPRWFSSLQGGPRVSSSPFPSALTAERKVGLYRGQFPEKPGLPETADRSRHLPPLLMPEPSPCR